MASSSTLHPNFVLAHHQRLQQAHKDAPPRLNLRRPSHPRPRRRPVFRRSDTRSPAALGFSFKKNRPSHGPWPVKGGGQRQHFMAATGGRRPHGGESDQRRRHTRRRPHARQPTRARWYALRGPAATHWASGPRPRRPGKADGRSTTGARGRTRSVARKEKGERRWCAPAALNAGSARHRRAAAPPQGQTAAAPGVGVGFQP